MGAVATPGGTAPSAWNKAVPAPPMMPPPAKVWSELLLPREYPLAFFEMSFLLPHFLKEGRGKLAMYFTRVYNPVWTNPDGMSWIEMLTDEAKVERHACLTPIWSETAWFADYVLPMGHASERHDLMSQETHAARWIGFRQPVLRVALERQGRTFDFTWQAHEAAGLGQVWEEDEFWIELSWRIDPDGALGIRKYFESPYRPGEKLAHRGALPAGSSSTACPGCPRPPRDGGPDAARVHAHVRRLPRRGPGLPHPREPARRQGARGRGGGSRHAAWPRRTARRSGSRWTARCGRASRLPRGSSSSISKTLKDWKWPEHAVPAYGRSHVHWSAIDRAKGEMLLLPTFRLPTLIHTRSGNAKWLYEISHKNPLWLHPEDAGRLGVTTGDLLRVETEIGHFVDKVWVTESIRPGVVACSHHLGRWRLQEEMGGERWSTALVDLQHLEAPGGGGCGTSTGSSPSRATTPTRAASGGRTPGVHQNLTFPVQPDPVSGQHCWHQKVRVVAARGGRPLRRRRRRHQPVPSRSTATGSPWPAPRRARAGSGGPSGCPVPSSPTTRPINSIPEAWPPSRGAA